MTEKSEQSKRVAWNKGLRTGYAPWRGKQRGPHSEQWKARISAGNRKPKSTEHAAHIAAARLGKTHSPETIAKIRETKHLHPYRLTDAQKAALSKRWRGSANPAYGKSSQHGPRTHWVSYKGVKLRSRYELRFAQALDAHGLIWQYEPHRFDLGDCTYLPDFYTPQIATYWEVKGWLDPKSMRKIERFRASHPDLPLVVVTDSVIQMMERLSNREQFGNAMKLTTEPEIVRAGGEPNGCRNVEDRVGLAAQ